MLVYTSAQPHGISKTDSPALVRTAFFIHLSFPFRPAYRYIYIYIETEFYSLIYISRRCSLDDTYFTFPVEDKKDADLARENEGDVNEHQELRQQVRTAAFQLLSGLAHFLDFKDVEHPKQKAMLCSVLFKMQTSFPTSHILSMTASALIHRMNIT